MLISYSIDFNFISISYKQADLIPIWFPFVSDCHVRYSLYGLMPRINYQEFKGTLMKCYSKDIKAKDIPSSHVFLFSSFELKIFFVKMTSLFIEVRLSYFLELLVLHIMTFPISFLWNSSLFLLSITVLFWFWLRFRLNHQIHNFNLVNVNSQFFFTIGWYQLIYISFIVQNVGGDFKFIKGS